ncbi:MAG: hypothetical protein NC344_10220 [Bacteroidales bacterium]|nr:hypothetical protein [Bacteroidales bacterium]MCM1148179.1 hypothetical protein [Bacteroidales bacterium]MCM1207094.1 hypothetical protein [Bacillota bacterium]MCM1510838.1 hypothetical protein [Clostridium sp.]
MAEQLIGSKVALLKDVRAVLGASQRNLHALCTHDSINKWAKFKPVCDRSPVARHDVAHGIPISSGIVMSNAAESDPRDIIVPKTRYEYERPFGGWPCRLGDFEGYKHNAAAPCIISPVVSLETNSTGEYVRLSAADHLSTYNLSFEDVIRDMPGFVPSEWRFAVMMTDANYLECRWFWTSPYAWDSELQDKNEVIININGLSLAGGDIVGLVPFLLKTGEDWEMPDYGGFPVSALPAGTGSADYKALALPVEDGADHFMATVVSNPVYSTLQLYSVLFDAAAYKVNQIVPGTMNERYNAYRINEVLVQIHISNAGKNYDYLNNAYIRAELALYDYYDVSPYYDMEELSPFKSYGAETVGESRLGVFSASDGDEDVVVNIDLTKSNLYLTYSRYDNYAYELRIYVYRQYFPGSEVLLKTVSIPYKADGTKIYVDDYYN